VFIAVCRVTSGIFSRHVAAPTKWRGPGWWVPQEFGWQEVVFLRPRDVVLFQSNAWVLNYQFSWGDGVLHYFNSRLKTLKAVNREA
jgi:hypothetical protein